MWEQIFKLLLSKPKNNNQGNSSGGGLNWFINNSQLNPWSTKTKNPSTGKIESTNPTWMSFLTPEGRTNYMASMFTKLLGFK